MRQSLELSAIPKSFKKKKPAIAKKILLHYIDELDSNSPPLPYSKIHLLNGGYCCY